MPVPQSPDPSPGPGPTTPPPPTSVQMVLMQATNDAIKSGVDPRLATDHLGELAHFLRAHPDHEQAANAALAQGRDPASVMQRMESYAALARTMPNASSGPPGPSASAPAVSQPTRPPLAPPLTRPKIPGVVADDTGVGFGRGKATPAVTPLDMSIPIFNAATFNTAPWIAGKVSGALGGNAQATQQEWNDAITEFQKEHPKAFAAGSMIGATLPVLATGGAGLTSRLGLTGAKAAAAEGAAWTGLASAGKGLAQGEDVSSIAKRGAVGALAGSVLGVGGYGLAKGVSNLAARSGLTDKLGEGLDQIGQKTETLSAKLPGTLGTTGQKLGTAVQDKAATLGTREQVNTALSTTQAPLEMIGNGLEGSTPADVRLAEQNVFQEHANRLYEVARQDTKPLQDPQLQELLADPQVQEGFQKVAAIRTAKGQPLPVAQEFSPNAGLQRVLERNGVHPDQIQRIINDPVASQKMMDQMKGLMTSNPETGESFMETGAGTPVPDAQSIADLKRYLYDAAVRGQNSTLGYKQDEAAALMGKVNAIRDRLHELSPDRLTADRYYAGGMGENEAWVAGNRAYQTMVNPTGEDVVTHSPEAIMQELNEPRYRGEPPEQIAARGAAFRQGMRDAVLQDARRTEVTKNAAGLFSKPSFQGDPATVQARSMMFNDRGQANAFEDLIAKMRGTALQQGSGSGNLSSTLPVSRFAVLRMIGKVLSPPNSLNTPEGQVLLSQRLRDPHLLSDELSAFRAGRLAPSAAGTFWGRLLPSLANGRARPTRPGPSQ